MSRDTADRFPAVERLLYDGETVIATLPTGDGRLVATTHRVLAFGTVGGERFRSVERANVDDVTVHTRVDDRPVGLALRVLALGAISLVAGAAVSLDGLAESLAVPSGTESLGLGGVFRLLSLLRTTLFLVDDALLSAGALALLVGLALLGRVLRTRRRVVRVTVAGGDDVEVPGEVEDESLRAFRDAVSYE